MPDEEDAEFGGCAVGEETEGDDVGGEEKEERGEEREDCSAINYKGGRGWSCGSIHCYFYDLFDRNDNNVVEVRTVESGEAPCNFKRCA